MILVADPNRLTADLLCRRLRADGFAAIAFADLLPALVKSSSSKVEAIVVDPALGGPSGGNVVARFRQAAPTVPILAFGASDGAQVVAEAIGAGAGAFLVKGRVSPTQLVERLRALIGSADPDRTGEATGSTAGTYYIQVDPHGGDADRLAIDIEAGPGLRCPECRSQMTLYLQRDGERWGKWLFGTFGCLVCAKRNTHVKTSHVPPTQPANELQVEPNAADGGLH